MDINLPTTPVAGPVSGPATGTASTITPEQRAKMRTAATDFEAYYITQFIGLMKGKNEDTQFNGGTGEEMFRQELNNELGKNLAKSGGFGIADKVYAELLKQQEAPAYAGGTN